MVRYKRRFAVLGPFLSGHISIWPTLPPVFLKMLDGGSYLVDSWCPAKESFKTYVAAQHPGALGDERLWSVKPPGHDEPCRDVTSEMVLVGGLSHWLSLAKSGTVYSAIPWIVVFDSQPGLEGNGPSEPTSDKLAVFV